MDKGNMQQTDGLWLKEGQIYIPVDTEIKLRILDAHYDRKTAGHLGQDKTLELIAQDYTWPGMREFVNEYVGTPVQETRHDAMAATASSTPFPFQRAPGNRCRWIS